MHDESESAFKHPRTANFKQVMNTCELSPEDMALALSLLADKKKKNDAELTFKKNLHFKIGQIFNALDIPVGDYIQIVEFEKKYTLIHNDSIFLHLGIDFNNSFAVRFSDESTRIEGYRGDKLEDQEDKSMRSNPSVCDRGYLYGIKVEPRKFFLNQIMKCPFCGISEVTETCGWSSWDFHWFLQDHAIGKKFSYPQRSEVYDSPMKLRRCRDHEAMSRKDYLSCKGEPSYLQLANEKRLELYRRIYPQNTLRDKKYYAEKRIRKVTKTRPLTKSEQMFFTMLLGASKLAQISKEMNTRY
jgi:hypothetical protein